MKSTIIYLLAVLCMTPVLLSCSDEPLNDQTAPECAKVPATRVDESARGYFRDITGFDPELQSQLIEMSFPVTVEGVQTNIDAQFSVMPIHVYEDSGDDKSGDYYVVEADFTAHNAALKDKKLFMKSLEVRVTPTSLKDEFLTEGTEVFFYDMPSPKTTIMNSTYEDSHNRQINAGLFIGKAPRLVEKKEYVWKRSKFYTTHLSQDMWTEFNVDKNAPTFIEDIYGNRIPIDVTKIEAGPNASGATIIIKEGTLDQAGQAIPKEMTNIPYELPCGHGIIETGIDGNKNIIRLFRTTPEGQKISLQCGNYRDPIFQGIEEYEGRQWTIWTMEDIIQVVNTTVPTMNFMCMANFGGGVSWGVKKVYYREDLTTRLNTDSHCSVDYKYVVENLDSSKGLPRVAQSDLNGHATWVWRMPVKDTKLTAEQLLSNLFKMKVEVKPVYGNIGNHDRNLSYDAANSTTMQTSVLSAPYRQKMTSIRFTNHGISPMMNVRLLTVPYLKWVEDGRPESEVLQQREDPLMAGESIIMPTVETSCYIVCEEINPRSLEVKCVRQSEFIDVKIDAKSPQQIKQSTFDTMPVLVYKN